MQLIFSDMPVPQEIVKSLFLAGPSPRSHNILDWRHEAIALLEEIGYDGTVFLPIPKGRFYGQHDQTDWTYIGQVEWEKTCRHVADKLVFWVPRDIKGEMPGFVTNVEFGKDFDSGKIIYGRPDSADKCRYLDQLKIDESRPIFNELKNLLQETVNQLGEGAHRQKGEVYVPLFVWQSEQFQSWYANVKEAGNSLLYAKVMNQVSFRNHLFCYTLHVHIWIAEEKRAKINECVISRKDISSVLAYYKDEDDTKIIVVREFRSPVNNKLGFVYELPGGSSVKVGIDPRENAMDELREETGISVEDMTRFEYVGTRQLAATMLTHQSVVYKIELTKEEYEAALKNARNKKTFGNNSEIESEITYIEVVGLKELFSVPIDYSMLGMIYQGLYEQK